jgi:glucose/arabinose dehydrogenase
MPTPIPRSLVSRASYAGLMVALLAVTPAPALGASPVPSFDPAAAILTLEPYVGELDSPVFVTGDGSGSGRLYAVEQPGRVVAIDPEGRLLDVPVLDIRDRVEAGGEEGLLGLALHPDVRANGRIYVDYTRREDGATTISEFTIGDDGTADPATERVILVIPQPYANHNGGMIAFDRDGMLLIGMGDGGAGGDPEGNGQDPEVLLGKILRIDVDGAEPYAIPEGNPFVDDATTRPEIWALGVRNPWRFSVDRLTGDLWIGDVGQGDWEEVDVIPYGVAGLNLGWNVMEGDACFEARSCDQAGLSLPLVTLSHDTSACSVIGGYVYRGSRFPALVGGYVFTDLCTGELWLLDAARAVASGAAAAQVVGTTGGSIVSFGEGDDGELYAVDQGGTILRLVARPAAGS